MTARPTKWPNYHEGDFVLRNYVFRSGETLPELRLHYRTLGTLRRNATGKIINGVVLLQGNTGTGANWLGPSLAEELFGPGQTLDPPRPMASCMIRYDVAFHDIGSSLDAQGAHLLTARPAMLMHALGSGALS
jgi:homoserine acetyltransferase